MAHYIHDEKNNRIEGMSKEEIYALIDEVIESGELPTDVQAAFVTAFKSIVDGKPYKMAFCTQAEYNEIVAQGELVEDALYIITDDSSYDDLLALINNAIAGFEATIDALPRTNELMQAEASEGQSEITLNEMTNNNNYVEVTGYVREDTTPTYCYYFSHRIKIQDVDDASGILRSGQSVLYLSDNDDIIIVTTRLLSRATWNYTKLNISKSNQGNNPSTKTYVFKILSVKELINY